MADTSPRYPFNTQLVFPNGAVYVYAQALVNLQKYEPIDLNINGKLVPYANGAHLPKGVVVEDVQEGQWTFVLVREGKEEPVGILTGAVQQRH